MCSDAAIQVRGVAWNMDGGWVAQWWLARAERREIAKDAGLRLLPDARQETKAISGYSAKGVHTTTFAELFFLPASGDIIDTPGIKEFGILDVAEEELSHFFPEMRQYLGQCKYNNCSHVNEPGCMVLQKLNEGYIHPYRYQSYLNILNEEDSHR